MPNLSSILPPNNIVTSENEATLTNKTLTDPIIQYVAGDTSFTVPAGTTAERPSSPETGELRFNTDEGSLEQYDGTNWGAVVPDDIDLNTLSINGTQVVDSSGNIDTGSVSINGTLLTNGESIRVPSGTTGERPASPVTGELRFNTDEGSFEKYDGSSWVPDLNDAPSDGNQYARQDGSWTQVAGGLEKDFVASGTISTGDVVVLQNDGTVDIVSQTVEITSADIGNEQVITTDTIDDPVSVYDSINDRICVFYGRSNSVIGVVGEISGTSISFGSEYVLHSQSQEQDIEGVAYDNINGIIVVVFFDRQTDYTSAIGTRILSDGTLDTSTNPIVVNTDNYSDSEIVFVSSVQRFVGVVDNSVYDFAEVFNISSDQVGNLTLESSNQFSNQQTIGCLVEYDEHNDRVVIFQNESYDNLLVYVADVSTSTVSVGSPITLFSSTDRHAIESTTVDTLNNKVIIAFIADLDSSKELTAAVGEVDPSTESISFGSFNVIDTNDTQSTTLIYDPDVDTLYFIYETNPTKNGVIISGQVTVNDTIDLDNTEVVFNTGETNTISSIYHNPSERIIISYSGILTAISVKGRYEELVSNADSFIGIANSSGNISDTIPVTVRGGIADNQSGLTPGIVYLEDDGALSTTDNGRKLGRSLSTTEILLKGE